MEKKKVFRPKRKDVFYLPVDEIEVEDGFNPRKDYGDIEALADSIFHNGVKNPLRGYKSGGKHLLTDGHRRLMAAKIVAKKNPELLLPFIIDVSEKSAEQRIIDVLVCNDGLKLNPLEESEVINRLINFGMDEREISKRTGQTGVYVSNLKLLYLAPQKIKNLISENIVSSTLAMDILRSTDNYEEAVKVIEKAHKFAQETGKEKIVKRDLEKSQGRTNSYSAIKKCFKVGAREDRTVRVDKVEMYNFVNKLINGELSKEELEAMFFED